MPGYDYIYLGDNARSPYGTRSFEVVYRFTKQAVETLFNEGCQLVILACNTASAKALRTIQQRDLPQWDPARRVLGVIRPTVDAENAGLSGDVVIDKVRSLPDGQGLNAATNEYEDLLAAGVTDPVKVTRSALQNAASIAGLFLTTEAVVANKPEPPAAAPAAGADMGY